jgi:hypothetical protein
MNDDRQLVIDSPVMRDFTSSRFNTRLSKKLKQKATKLMPDGVADSIFIQIPTGPFSNSRLVSYGVIITTCIYFLTNHKIADSFCFSYWLFPYYYLFLNIGFFLYLNFLMD